MDLLEKIYSAFLERGSEIDDCDNDEKYLKLERLLTIELSITKLSVFKKVETELDQLDKLYEERNKLLLELEIT